MTHYNQKRAGRERMYFCIKRILLGFLGLLLFLMTSCTREPATLPQQTYEYDIVEEYILAPANTSIVDAINKKAKDGWRLIQIDRRISDINGTSADSMRDGAKAISFYCKDHAAYVFERVDKNK